MDQGGGLPLLERGLDLAEAGYDMAGFGGHGERFDRTLRTSSVSVSAARLGATRTSRLKPLPNW